MEKEKRGEKIGWSFSVMSPRNLSMNQCEGVCMNHSIISFQKENSQTDDEPSIEIGTSIPKLR